MVKILTSPVQGDVPFGGHKATGLADPTSAQDASTKAYVDAVAQGLSVKASVRAASTANIASQSGLLTVDGVTLVDGDRVLAKDQTTGSTNGIWVAHSGAWTRAADADAAGELVGAFVFVEEGATNAGSGWVQTAAAPITVGTTSLTWTQFSGAGQIVAGAGLAKAGNTLRRAASATGYANLAALPSAAANNGLLERTADGGIYESDGSAWQPVRDPSGTSASAVDLSNVQSALATETSSRLSFEAAAVLPPFAESAVTGLVSDLAAITGRLAALEGKWLDAVKAADATPFNANTTFATDADLQVTVAASSVYDVFCVVAYDSSTAADLKLRWTAPTGATMPNWTALGLTSAAAGTTGQISPFALLTITTSAGIGGAGVGSIMFALLRGRLTVSTTAGIFGLQWAQNTSDATNTIVRAGSFLSLRKV